MAIDLPTETPLTLTAAVEEKWLSIDGRRLHPSTLWRWARKGVRGVRLEYVRVGNRIVTSREALGRFLQRLAEADTVQEDQDAATQSSLRKKRFPRIRTALQRQRDIERARRELEKAGI